ncbi:MAG: hypothetical protein JST84_29860 [Acidobacteria bacterium]|nr:hypothetical protein [Acidobacteriota bacterium]
MRWNKRGLIYEPNRQYDWNQSHAAVPVVDQLNDKVWRIYYATRDKLNRSRISYIEVEAGRPEKILYEHPEPVLDLGNLGAFDDCGVMPSWVVDAGAQKYLYYIGLTVMQRVPYHNSIGLAISNDGGRSFTRYAEGPLFGLTAQEPHFTGTSCILQEDGVWKNWYLSCVKWEVIEGKPEPFYHLKYAESPDGIHWQRTGKVAIDFKSSDEAGIVKASVLRENHFYRMWYAYRSANEYRTSTQTSYRIGYAESLDGKDWTRLDEQAGIDLSESGWDAGMIAYPHVVTHHGNLYLFYNGNGFGQSGFGYAVAERL